MGSTAVRAAVLLCDGFQELEFWYPVLRFREQQVPVQVIGSDGDRTCASRLQYPVNPDQALDASLAKELDVVVVPGADFPPGCAMTAQVARFIADAHDAGAVVGLTSTAIGLLEAAGLAAKAQVATPAGPRVVSAKRIVTACDADDLPAFFPALSEAIEVARNSRSGSTA